MIAVMLQYEGAKADKTAGVLMKKSALKKNLPLLITGLVAAGLVAAAAYVRYSRPSGPRNSLTTPTLHPGAGAAGINDSSDNTSSSGSNGTSNTTSPSPTPSPSTDPQYNSSTLAKPTQTINKSHSYVSLSATDQADPQHSPSMDSTCTSVAGATCEIRATLGGTVITVVPATPVDTSTLGIDVAWNAKDRGLTPGTWVITAVAKKDGQTSTSDPISIEVRA